MIGSRLLGALPAHANSRSLGLRRPVAVRAFSRHPPGAPRCSFEAADRQTRPAVRGRPGRCTAGTRWLLVSRARRLLATHARGRRHVARSRARASRSSCRTSRARKSRSARRAARASPASTPSFTNTHSATKASPRATWACACCARCCRGNSSAGVGAGRLELAGSARRLHSLRTAPGARSFDRIGDARRRAGIPWLRLNDQSLVQLGHGVSAIQAVSGRTPHIAVELASDKEETNKISCVARFAGAASGRAERRAGGARRAHRLSRRHQALQRQSRPRISIRLTAGRGSRARVQRRARAFALGDRRVVPRRRRSSPAGRQRRAGGGDAAHAGPRRRRRRAHDRAADRDREPGSAPRRRPRESADAARARCAGRRCWSVPASPRSRCRSAAGSCASIDGESLHRRHGHRRDRRHSSRQPRHGSARDSRDRPRRRRRRLPVAEHRRELSHDRRRHLRGQCGSGLPHARRAERRTARDVAGPRSSTCCSRRARRHACRSRRSQARTQDDDCAHARAHHEDGRLHPA